ncbi:glycosyltransferase family 2 protein [Flavobacterium suncheonense]|uniref:glycosyltransferase family 2 protein n=1 Tax=Flavobacterium suncheonense TaxID=350894 RepID=UPI0003F84439|nr:glycosyltransferase family 2 protein [Flavobacterium suncheonense]
MENILLSVITINYNDAKGLKKTMDSVVRQTWKGFEYLVIDGGSTDESPALIEAYQSDIAYSVSEKDNGIYNAMNKGIKAAKGKYLLFLNSGDYLVADTVFENVFSSFTSDADFICGNLYYEQAGKAVVKEHPEQMTFSYLVARTVYHPSTFIKRALFDQYGLYNENNKIVSDWEFFFKALGLNGASYKKLSQTITHFDMNGISSVHGEKVQEEKLRVFKNYLPYVFNNENDRYIFDKFRETNKRFRMLREIDERPFFRKFTTFQLSATIMLMKLFEKRK